MISLMDAVKFVERQVQNVGDQCKKVLYKVMQDLVSQDSTDSAKLPVTDFPRDTNIDEYKSSSSKEDTKKVEQSENSFSGDSTGGSFGMQDKKGETYTDNTAHYCEKVSEKVFCDKYRKTTLENPVSENQDRESLVSEIVHESATTEHMVLTSPQDSVVVGWKWDSGEDEKDMESYEHNDVDEFTVKGPISTNVLSSRTTGEGLAQDFIEIYSSIKSNVLGECKFKPNIP
ncbi:hypothetical protein POM88_048979 [Heracleum sosnowskyi]|uniref:Uncharacterized protein n=1 Tax=Heracleum sosnowskyi TaxID=360622 RepID=A0AAD8GXD4_9APIA|nr:hypothetical protein POM88_048979 [Heracleum sosnowskyi]